MRSLIYTAFLTVCTTILYAQPMNDDCLGAILIPTTTNYCSAPMEFSNVESTPDIIMPVSEGQMAITTCVWPTLATGYGFSSDQNYLDC